MTMDELIQKLLENALVMMGMGFYKVLPKEWEKLPKYGDGCWLPVGRDWAGECDG